jgi:DNA-binding Xre family transcriptional regulator
MPKIDKLSRTTHIFLNDSFRAALIKEAIEKAGSMRQLGRIMGYTGPSPNWSIKRIAEGKQGIPLSKLERLCTFMGISLKDIENEMKYIKSGRSKVF